MVLRYFFSQVYFILLFFLIFYLLFLEGKGGRKRGRETAMCGFLSCAPYWGPGLQPRPVPWLGIRPANPCFSGPHSIHWTIQARTYYSEKLLRTSKSFGYMGNVYLHLLYEKHNWGTLKIFINLFKKNSHEYIAV